MHHNNNSLNLHGLDINEETWKKQLMVLVENEVQTLSKLDDMKSLVENLIQKTPRNQHEQIVSLADLQNIKSTMGDMKSTYLNMIKDRDVATKIADKAISTSQELRVKVEELTNELESTKNALGNTQNALLEVEDQLYVAKQFREQENRERDKEIKQVIEEQDNIQLVDNPLFEMDTNLLLIIHFLSGMMELFLIPVMRWDSITGFGIQVQIPAVWC
jgi:hypothetical protein